MFERFTAAVRPQRRIEISQCAVPVRRDAHPLGVNHSERELRLGQRLAGGGFKQFQRLAGILADSVTIEKQQTEVILRIGMPLLRRLR